MRYRTSHLLALLIAVCALVGWLVGSGRAQPPLLRNADPSAPIKIPGKPGYAHLNQYLERQPTHIATNMEPVIPHPREVAAARRKLAALEQKSGARPNVLVFLVDDCGWMDFGFNGGGIAVGNPTPNLDRYAAEGLILTSCYAQPTCSPTRATILTGQLPIHHGILSPPMYGQPGGLDGAITIAKLLSDQGYTTQCIGKWHCGENVGSQPQNVGFDAFRGFLSVSDMYTEWRDPHFNPEIALSPERTAWMQKVPFNKHEVRSTKGGKIENIRVIDIDVAKNLDQDWAKHGEEFLRKQKDNSKPFFLYYNTRAAHFDNYPNEYYQGRSPARTVYSDAIVEIDDIFGRLMKTLEETGQAENTLVFFTSDNGPEAEVAPYGRTPFRGAKGSTWEGGMRVPTFAYWKGMIKPRKSDGLFDLADLFNTSLSLAGKPGAEAGKLVPKDRYIDGIDQTSFLLADNGQSNRKSILYFLKAKFSGVRVDEFKVMKVVQLPTTVNQRGNLGGLSGTINEAVEGLLFNLYTNPKEDDSVLIRHLPAAIGLSAEALRYQTVLKKFPSNIKSPLD